VCNLWPIFTAVKFVRENRGDRAKSKAHFRKLLNNVDFRYSREREKERRRRRGARENTGFHSGLKRGRGLLKLLLIDTFRNLFYVYLSKQFCQENLLFYEVVLHWKDLHEDDSTRQEKLRSVIAVVSNLS
jgi:hypothetical protein